MADRRADREHLRVAEAAALLGVGDTLVRRLFDEGVLLGHRLPRGGHRRITRQSVEELRREMRGDES